MSTEVYDWRHVEVAQELAVADERRLHVLVTDHSRDFRAEWRYQSVARAHQHRQVSVLLDKPCGVFDQRGGHQGLVPTHAVTLFI